MDLKIALDGVFAELDQLRALNETYEHLIGNSFHYPDDSGKSGMLLRPAQIADWAKKRDVILRRKRAPFVGRDIIESLLNKDSKVDKRVAARIAAVLESYKPLAQRLDKKLLEDINAAIQV